jgi:hypothetical protein
MLPGAGDRPQDPARAVGAGVQLGAEPASAAAMLPAAPLAARCALQVVLSSSSSPSAGRLGRSASKTTSHQPPRHPRRQRWQTLDHRPRASGRSRHGAPVRQIQRAAPTKRRSAAPSRFQTRGICGSTSSSDTHWASSRRVLGMAVSP